MDISTSLKKWKEQLESDSRNPVYLQNLQWEPAGGITLDPVYDSGSLGPEHGYLKEFHSYWKASRTDFRPVLKASSLTAKSLNVQQIAESEKLGFAAWTGPRISTNHTLPLEIPFADDPISESLKSGKISASLQALMQGKTPEALEINATAFHHAGAGPAEDLAYCLSLAAHYHELTGDAFPNLASNLVLHVSTGTTLFLEIARLRAMRLLWMNFTSRCGMEKQAGKIQAESSLREWSKTDPDSNLLRHTASAMAGILGGADSILIHPHTLDEAQAMDAIRQSVNLGHLALEEAGLSASFDPGSGSYLIEILTHELSKKAWELFCEWHLVPLEEKLRSGFFVRLAENGAEKLRDEYSAGKRVMTGVNKHPSPLSRPCPAWPVDAVTAGEFPALSPVFLDA